MGVSYNGDDNGDHVLIWWFIFRNHTDISTYIYVYIYIYAGHHDFLLLYKGGASIGITTSIIDSMCIYIYCIIYHLICIYYISEILVVMVVIKRLADVE